MSIHIVGVSGLILVFVIGTLRPINLGSLALVMTFLVGTIFVGEGVKEMYGGFPVDLLVLLAGVTYLFGIAENNGTVARVVEGAARLVKDRRALIPWVVFVVAALPAMAGALGSAGVALLAPLALRLAQRYDIDRRMIGLMVVHGAASGNFSPLNVLSAIVTQAVTRNGLAMSSSALFLSNLAYNVVLAAIIYVVFGGLRLSWRTTKTPLSASAEPTTSYRAACGNHRDNAVIARRAGVKTLVLTHVLDYIDRPGIREQIIYEVRQEFDGKVIWGEDLMQLELPFLKEEHL